MHSIRRKIRDITLLFLICSIFFSPHILLAQQDAVTLTVTPPFFQLTINPDETWSSFIKVVNVNDFDLTLYASAVNFEATGDGNGKGKFTPLLSEDPEYRKASLAGWIDVTDGPIVVSAGGSVRVPFSIHAPANASPGGHYAAILIGTQPVREEAEGPFVSVSSSISTLIFARISGDVIEEGDIREFSTQKTFYQEPDVSMTVRFENTGNVHLLPQGEITIFNMWGKERGRIPINQNTDFGNVLPKSTRNYTYTWTGEKNPFEAGRYKAITTLSYGQDSKKNVSSITTFWVVPVVPVASIVGTAVLLVLVTLWFIRRYVRRALGTEAQKLGFVSERRPKKATTLAQPLVDGVMDLRNIRLDASSQQQKAQYTLSFGGFIRKYKLFFIFIGFLIIAGIIFKFYFSEVLVGERAFDVQYEEESLIDNL